MPRFLTFILVILCSPHLVLALPSLNMRRDVFSYIDQPLDQASHIFIVGGYRMYQPRFGVFIKQDNYSPFVSEKTANGFDYAAGNPILAEDSTGHIPEDIIGDLKQVLFALPESEETGVLELLGQADASWALPDDLKEAPAGIKMGMPSSAREARVLMKKGTKISHVFSHINTVEGGARAVTERIEQGTVAEDIWVSQKAYDILVTGEPASTGALVSTPKLPASQDGDVQYRRIIVETSSGQDDIHYVPQQSHTLFSISPRRTSS